MKRIVTSAILTTFAITSSQVAFAHHCKKHHCKKHHHHATQQAVVVNNDKQSVVANDYKSVTAEPMLVSTFTPYWYVGGHMGISRTHDKAAAGSGDSVTQVGPGWTVDLGYQFAEFHRAMFAAELGYTQYHNSNETTSTTNPASTEHFATYLAGVVQYPFVNNFGVLGKLGVAYSYAKKVFTASAASRSANAYSLYYGAGLFYNMTPKAALVLQWARARGSSGGTTSTGSTDLTSLGLTYNLA
ncbi:MAG: outer membrane beta-barrel protein [Gammaproteobacteria bacterium]|nr:outer membrane beta-barrel protein [Gammaproteobacteria bacterium]